MILGLADLVADVAQIVLTLYLVTLVVRVIDER